jgi:hypothetical protein
MTLQDLALGLSRMGRAYSPLATLDGTGATCVEVGMRELAERLLASGKVVKMESGCWEWTGKTGKLPDGRRGYGKVSVNGKQVPAHRVFYLAFVGPIPDGLVMDHTCINRPCVNPDHLRAVTVRINNRENRITERKHRFTNDDICLKCGAKVRVYIWNNGRDGKQTFRRCGPCDDQRRIAQKRAERERKKAQPELGV